MVYVDQLFTSTNKAKSGARHVFGSGRQSCHMFADSREELDTMARRLGLRLEWVQDADRPYRTHYDLVPAKRALAIQYGAQEVDAGEFLTARMQVAKAQTAADPHILRCAILSDLESLLISMCDGEPPASDGTPVPCSCELCQRAVPLLRAAMEPTTEAMRAHQQFGVRLPEVPA